MVPARVTRLARSGSRLVRRQVSARLAGSRGASAAARHVRLTYRGVPVTARVDPALHLGAHQAEVVESVTRSLDERGLPWWRIPDATGAAVLAMHVRDRAAALVAMPGQAGPAWYSDEIDERGQPRASWRRGRARTGAPAGVLLWEFVVAQPGSRFLAGPDQAVAIWFFDDGPEGTVQALVSNTLVGALPPGALTTSGSVPAPLRARPSALVGFPIDVVYTWVDGVDDGWLAEKARAAGVADPALFTERAHDESRYADHDELRYSLRSLEQFAPWVNHVWVVTADQHPSWLAQDDPWVTVVRHADIWPDAQGLPTFNSHAIETCLHRIPGLAEHFLYLNDDMLLGRPVPPETFFHPNGLSKFYWSRALVDHGPVVTGEVASTTAAKAARRLLEERYDVTFTRKFFHTAAALTVSGLTELEATFPDVVEDTRRAPFRTVHDVAVAGSLYLNWAYATGRSVPGRLRYTYIDPAAPDAARRLDLLERRRAFDAFCVNDGSSEETPEQRRATDRLIRAFFAAYLPVPGSFEVVPRP